MNEIILITGHSLESGDYLDKILASIRQCQLSVIETRHMMAAQGGATILMAAGNWDGLAKLENMLKKINDSGEVSLNWGRIKDLDNASPRVPYQTELFGYDRPGILEGINRFMRQRKITVASLNSSSQPGPDHSSMLFNAHLLLMIPADTRISLLREEFMEFCDRENLDAVLEPAK